MPPSRPFAFPPIHDFPPFYTEQPNLETWARQRQLWSDLILEYHAHNRLYLLDINEAISKKLTLVSNQKIGRSLRRETLQAIVEELVKKGNAEWESGGASKGRAWIYWRKPEEWAALLYRWVVDSGQTNSVCSVEELLRGDSTEDEEFHGLDDAIMKKALDLLVKQGKAQTFYGSSGSDLGVKFF
ncbi:ESCRT-II complex subunit-domain-containing protein [Cladochytrium replicatum]|nr:ESCRT-II complex subunit-domain-containing protein [Cladochytrium replicatum]